MTTFYRSSLLMCLMIGLSACGGEGAPNTRVSAAQFSKADVAFAPEVEPDAFYHANEEELQRAPGSILDSRPVPFTLNGQELPNEAWQIKFASRNSAGEPIVGMATVVKPTIASVSPKLVSFQIAYNGLGARCTPSQTLSGNSDADNGVINYGSYGVGLNALGWTMVFPDFEGPYHTYGAGKLSGQVTLDAIRAAQAFEPLGLQGNAPTMMWGYSGGAIATSWASALHPVYANELNLIGAVSGGTPADLLGVARGAEDQFFFGLVFSALVGINREFPQLFEGKLNAEGLRVAKAIKDGCGGVPADGSEGASGNISKFVNVDDFYNQPHMLELEKSISLPQAAGNPRIPVFFYHEILDEVIPVEGVDKVVDAWCAKGTPVTYLRSLTGEHLTGSRFTPEALDFIESRFAGRDFLLAPTATRCN